MLENIMKIEDTESLTENMPTEKVFELYETLKEHKVCLNIA